MLKIAQNFNKSFFLFGPRGTGKTYWVRNYVPEAIYVDLLNTDIYMDLSANPHRLEAMIPTHFNGWIIIDEVQKIPDLLNEVHRLIENRPIKFILTGSSARSLRKKGVNLLAGRALEFHMHPLTVWELGSDFKLENSLEYGNLPSISSEPDAKKYLKTYVNTYLREEVLQEGLTRRIGAFARFLEAASFSQGSTLNISEIARDCRVDRKMAEHYFGILEDLLIGIRLPVFNKRAKRRIITHPKFYFFDTGVYRALRPTGPFDSPEEIEGAALETLFFQEIRAIIDYLDLGYDLYYWRDSTGLEVDFVLYGARGIFSFEIKRAKALRSRDLKALRIFQEDYPEAKCFVLYGGSKREYHGSITALPFVEGIKSLREIIA